MTFRLTNLVFKNRSRQNEAGIWCTDEQAKIISTGEIKNQESILALLHELGHAQKPEDMRKARTVFKGYGKGKPFNYETSYIERNAWADAIRIMKTLREEGVNLFEVFEWEKIKRFIFASLAHHRLQARLEDLKSTEVAMEIMKESTGLEPKFAEENLLYLEKLFDRGGSKFRKIEN